MLSACYEVAAWTVLNCNVYRAVVVALGEVGKGHTAQKCQIPLRAYSITTFY